MKVQALQSFAHNTKPVVAGDVIEVTGADRLGWLFEHKMVKVAPNQDSVQPKVMQPVATVVKPSKGPKLPGKKE